MRIGLAFLISLAVTIVMGFLFIPVLRRLKAGQSIKRDGPVWHLSKEGTPTMGASSLSRASSAPCSWRGSPI